ncbi:TPA: phage tail protein [Escherichia coli]
MTVKYYAILTNQGAARLANATMLGSKLNLTQMAVGDANGVLPTPDPAQTKLINQKRIAPLNLLSVDPNNQNQIIAEQIIPENEGGFWIREIGLYDDEGVLIAVANCPETYKPQLQEGSGRTQTIRMILVVTNTEAITLKIDPSVVLATRKYVDDKISEHEQSRRHPDASLTVKGFTQLSSAINSESETLAATPKAVKAAYDLANGKYTAQNATTTQKGIVQLSSATNSTSETLAATPKAVKAVMDETNKKAPLNSPTLTGTPTTPTAPQGANSTQIANTAFVMAAIAALVDSSPDALNTLNELAAALGNDPNFATTMTNALAGKQPKDATLTALAELATSADKLPYFTGADRAALTALTSVGRAILGKTSTQGVLDYLGLPELLNLKRDKTDNRFSTFVFESGRPEDSLWLAYDEQKKQFAIAFKVDGAAKYVYLQNKGGSLALEEQVTAQAILTKLLQVDGSGSGLDADLVRGLPADFGSSPSTNGYQKLPSGMIIQWGMSEVTPTDVYVKFPVAFTRPPLFVGESSPGGGQTTSVWTANAITNVGFNATQICVLSNTSDRVLLPDNNATTWLAIGF